MDIEQVRMASPELEAAMQRLFPQLTTSVPCPDMAALEDLVHAPASQLLIAREPDAAGPIVAMGSLAVYQVPTGIHAVIEDVVVDGPFRGRGIGEELVRQLIELARSKGARGVSLTSNSRRESANRLYLRMGFRLWATNHYYYSLA
jgi:ribosomal protein S18 acetylase RimI-like enzyme